MNGLDNLTQDLLGIKSSQIQESNSSEIDRLYRKVFMPTLLHLSKGCPSCGDMQNGMDLDHFVVSKKAGGSFIILNPFPKANNKLLLNNCIPLCRSCNRSKQDQFPSHFFAPSVYVKLCQLNNTATRLLDGNDFADLRHMVHTLIIKRGIACQTQIMG